MKQVIQSFKTGELQVIEVPPPQLRSRGILVRTAASVVSPGTERKVVDFAEKNLLQKAQARPDLVRQVLDKVQREGLLNTVDAVRNRLEQALALGYSACGVVTEVGAEALPFQIGDRVACAGGGYASHAEMMYIPRTLAVKLPDTVSFESAAFTTLGAVAMQGIRLGEISLGSHVLVIGLGLIGQLTLQLVKAAGGHVLAADLNSQRVDLALKMGADAACLSSDLMHLAPAFTANRGFDTILITAATSSNEPIETAGQLARDRGIVVAVGLVGMDIPHKPYYEKELTFRISRSYGAGRYDPQYEEQGQDYPYGYVRWTEQRNMEAVVQLMAAERLQVDPLITHRFSIDRAEDAYDLITGKTWEDSLGVVLQYDLERPLAPIITLKNTHAEPDAMRLGLVGAGLFANSTLLPALQKIEGIYLNGIMSASGISARQSAERFDFAYCTSSFEQLLNDQSINWLVILTRHHLHAAQAIQVLEAGKHVFVEKPLALDAASLQAVIAAQQDSGKWLMVGFNRRFAPLVIKMREFFQPRQRPLIITYRVNAGYLPPEHWLHDPQIGGGRLIGEGCHFIDLLGFLIGAKPVQVTALSTSQADEAVITLTYADGSLGTVIYSGAGDKAYSKERIEMIGDGKIAVLDDFQSLELVADGRRSQQRARLRSSKGHREIWAALAAAFKAGGEAPISLENLIDSHRATFAAVESLRLGQPVSI